MGNEGRGKVVRRGVGSCGLAPGSALGNPVTSRLSGTDARWVLIAQPTRVVVYTHAIILAVSIQSLMSLSAGSKVASSSTCSGSRQQRKSANRSAPLLEE